MLKRFRDIILVVLPLALGFGISSASAAARTLPGCNNPADSAFNQYCDSTPSPTGPQRPQPGAPSLGTALPPRVARQLGRAQAGQTVGAQRQQAGSAAGRDTRSAEQRRTHDGRALLELPAPGRHHALSTSRAAIPSAWSLSPWMILILVALTLALIGIAAARWRRQRHGTPD